MFALKWYRRQIIQRFDIPARDVTKGHRWCFIDIFSHPALCNICQTLMVDGGFCDSCGICADHGCMKTADKELFCKSLSRCGTSMKHHWIHGNSFLNWFNVKLKTILNIATLTISGNLPFNSVCDVCEEKCGYEDHPTQLSDYRCCWCQRTVHSVCQPKMADICDLGKFREFIVPPIW